MTESQRLKGPRSWELEMLLSGMVTIVLFSLPTELRNLGESLSVCMHGSVWIRQIPSMLGGMLAGACMVFACNLVLHLILRTVWVGSIGIASVLDGAPVLEKLINGLDVTCSLLFGIVVIFIASIWAAGVFMAFMMLSLALSGNSIMWPVLIWVFLGAQVYAYLGPYLFRGLRPAHWRMFRWLTNVSDILFLIAIIRPLYRGLREVLKPWNGKFRWLVVIAEQDRAITPILLVYVATFILVLASSRNTGVAFTQVFASTAMNSSQYESSLGKDNPHVLIAPVLASEIQLRGILRLFIPVSVSDEDTLARRHGLQSLYRNIIRAQLPPGKKRLASSTSLEQVRRLFSVAIDDSLITGIPAYHYIHPHNDEYGLLLFLDTQSLADGPHTVRVRRTYVVDPQEYRIRQEYEIPFLSVTGN